MAIDIDIESVIEALIADIGTDNVVIDASAVSGIDCGGILIQESQPTTDILRALMDCYDFVVREDDGVLVFIPRGSEDQIAVSSGDIAAHEEGQDAPRPWSVDDKSSINLPREVNISYVDPSIDWQKASEKFRRINGLTETCESYNLPMTMTAAEAKAIAKRRLWTAWLNRSPIRLPLPPKYLTLRENDILILTDPADDETFLVRIQRITRGLNYLLEIEGVIENTLDSSFAAEGEDHEDSQIITPPVPVGFIFIDICSLSDTYIDNAGYYAAAFSLDPDRSFNGAFLYDGFTNVLRFSSGATAGFTVNAMGSANGYTWDRVNKVTVELFSGSLESVTEAQCLAGSNRALIGDEIIGFQTATLTGTNTYELSNLIRGLGDTRDEIDSHEAREVFLLLETAKLKFKTINNNEIGIEKSFKILSPGEYFDNEQAVAATPNAYNLRPFTPCHIRCSWDGDNNLTIQWSRRTRSIVELLTELPIPLSEASEAYEIDIIVEGSVIRTIEATEESCQYTSAQQTSDGITREDIESVRIYQLSAVVGRGKYGEKIL